MIDIILTIFFITLIPMLMFAPWIPTRGRDLDRIAEIMEIKDNDVIYDLGSGDGKVLFNIAKKHNCKLIGIESYFLLFLFSVIKRFIYFPNKDIEFKLKGIFQENLKNATKIYIFGLEHKMEKLGEKIKKECKKGTIIISYAFKFPNLKQKNIDKPNSESLSLYVYELD